MKVKLTGQDSRPSQGAVNEAGVSSNGELITRAFDYSDFASQTLNVIDTAFNHVKPKSGFQFVITGLLVSGNRDIGVNGSILTIYTADSATSTTTIDTPFELEVPKSTVLPIGALPNIITDEGVFINSKCDDDVVRVGLFGYFVPAR